MGRIRNMVVRFLWLQNVVMRKRLELKKVGGKKNQADVLTKRHNVVRELLSMCKLCFEDQTRVRGEGVCRTFEPFLSPNDDVRLCGESLPLA